MPAPRHLIMALLLLSVAAGSVSASAASLGGVQGRAIAAGTASVTACDGAVGVAYATSGGRVTSVTVSGIADPACSGAVLRARVVSSDGAALAAAGPATVPADGDTADDSLTLAVADGPLAEAVAGAAISIAGP